MSSDYGLAMISWVAFGCFMGFLCWMSIDSSILLDRYLTKWIVSWRIYSRIIRRLCSTAWVVVMGLLPLGAGHIGYEFFSPDFRQNHWGIFLAALFSGYFLWNIFVRWIWGMRNPLTSRRGQ